VRCHLFGHEVVSHADTAPSKLFPRNQSYRTSVKNGRSNRVGKAETLQLMITVKYHLMQN
jgi:hypothetical protein